MRSFRLCLMALLLLAPNAWPQTNQELAAQIGALQQRIEELESEVETLKTALLASEPALPAGPAPPAPLPGTTPGVQTQATMQGAADPTAAARLMNPAIGVIGNLVGGIGSNPFALDPAPSVEMAESEVSFRAAVDPYARADFFLSFGEEGVDLEEGYVTFSSLPGGFSLRTGKMRAQFGKVNTLHRHMLPWVDRPLVTTNLLGGEEGIADAGFSLSRLLPAPGGLFLEASGEVYRGDVEGLFEAGQRSHVAAIGRLRSFSDLSEASNLEFGFSYGRGHNGTGGALVTNLYGLDSTFRWKPLRRARYRSFIGRTELVWSRRREPGGLQKAFGYYLWGEYQFARRWFAGVRYDESGRMAGGEDRDKGLSATLTFWPSEFSQIRAQYRRTRFLEDLTTDELLFQFQFNVGAHGAHPF